MLPEWSEKQKDRLEKLASEAEHRAWLFSGIKSVSIWIAAVVVGGRYAWEALTHLIAWLRGP